MKKRIGDPDRDLSTLNYAKGLSNAKLEQLEEFLAALKNM
uniref:Uncharacterized protein n=1 Tax=Rhizophora mucronata TaxID=61149 RepID=A0A2P2Q8U8_RHIMU